MQFKKITRQAIVGTGLGLLLTPMLALAAEVTIHNNTDQPSTSIINNGICSSYLPGGIGVTQPHSVNTIPSVTVYSACWADRDNCKADIYMTSDCSGPLIGKVTLSVSEGVKDIVVYGDYSISGNGFDITVG
jgi:hypothetical protein